MSVFHDNALIGAAGAGVEAGFQIDRSLRFNDDDSAYLNRTPSSAGNRKTWTWSNWVKRSNFGDQRGVFSSYAGSHPTTSLVFDAADTFTFWNYNGSGYDVRLTSSAVFRDFSAWYHFVIAVDTTQATASNRVKIYVNGEQVTAFGRSDYPSSNFEFDWNSATQHNIGKHNVKGLDGYLADVHFIDGQALAATDFGEYDDNNVWQPKAYAGTYGTNGFHLDFSDNSSAAALGTDTSGNSNTWTINNLSVASGAGNDSLIDTPMNYQASSGNNGGNYCTWNSVASTPSIISNGNLETAFTNSSSSPFTRDTAVGSIAVSSGKYYWEVDISGTDAAKITVGIFVDSIDYSNAPTGFRKDSSNLDDTTAKLGLALDVDAGTLKLYEDNTLTYTVTFTAGSLCLPAISLRRSGAGSASSICNFGQRPFAYTPPTNHKSLCTTNLADPTIADGSTAFDAVLYTGNGTSNQVISGYDFSPDFVWIKKRSSSGNHSLFDIVRGTTRFLYSNLSNAEAVGSQGLKAFNSDGFTTGSSGDTGQNNQTYVAWAWDGGSSTVSNTDGSITSNVRANASAGFSIVSWTGGTNPGSIGHGLGVSPELIITKSRDDGTSGWYVYHKSLGAGVFLRLDVTNAGTSSSTAWNNTTPSSTVISFNSTGTNPSGDNIAYCFAPVNQYSSFGSWEGNGSSDGPFVFTNFRPALVIYKNADTAYGWQIYDSTRDPDNVCDTRLSPTTSNAEDTTVGLDMLSNGFKIRTTHARTNNNGDTFVYAAFAEHPFKTARAR